MINNKLVYAIFVREDVDNSHTQQKGTEWKLINPPMTSLGRLWISETKDLLYRLQKISIKINKPESF